VLKGDREGVSRALSTIELSIVLDNIAKLANHLAVIVLKSSLIEQVLLLSESRIGSSRIVYPLNVIDIF
jgi:hypothetical protein